MPNQQFHRAGPRCFSCGENGHISRNCVNRASLKLEANAVKLAVGPSSEKKKPKKDENSREYWEWKEESLWDELKNEHETKLAKLKAVNERIAAKEDEIRKLPKPDQALTAHEAVEKFKKKLEEEEKAKLEEDEERAKLQG